MFWCEIFQFIFCTCGGCLLHCAMIKCHENPTEKISTYVDFRSVFQNFHLTISILQIVLCTAKCDNKKSTVVVCSESKIKSFNSLNDHITGFKGFLLLRKVHWYIFAWRFCFLLIFLNLVN